MPDTKTYHILVAPDAYHLEAVSYENLDQHFQKMRSENPSLGELLIRTGPVIIQYIEDVSAFYARSCYITRPDQYEAIADGLAKIPGVIGVTKSLDWSDDPAKSIDQIITWSKTQQKGVLERSIVRDERESYSSKRIQGFENRNQILYKANSPLCIPMNQEEFVELITKESYFWQIEGIIRCWSTEKIIPYMMEQFRCAKPIKAHSFFIDYSEVFLQDRNCTEIPILIKRFIAKQLRLSKTKRNILANCDYSVYKFYSQIGYYYKVMVSVSTEFLRANTDLFLYPANQTILPK